MNVQISTVATKDEAEFVLVYKDIFSSVEEIRTFYGRFLSNGWISGAWKENELVGVITWAPRESAKDSLAEIIDFWVKPECRRQGIGSALLDHALEQMQQYYRRFGSTLTKVMLFTRKADRVRAATALYEKKGFKIVASILRNSLDNPYGDDLLYVLQMEMPPQKNILK